MSYDKRKLYSAGILPYTIRNNEIYYLLGRDWRDEGWSDFGGKAEEGDENDIATTAIREFYEETLGVVKYKNEMNADDINRLTCIQSVTLNGSPYHMYLMYVNDECYNKYFHKTYTFVKQSIPRDAKYLEKCELSWVSSRDMKGCHIKLRSIFKRTLNRCKDTLESFEKEVLKGYALKE